MMKVDAQTLANWEKDYQRKKVEDPHGLSRDAMVARRHCRCGGCWCCFVWRRAQEDERKRDE